MYKTTYCNAPREKSICSMHVPHQCYDSRQKPRGAQLARAFVVTAFARAFVVTAIKCPITFLYFDYFN